MPTVAEIADFLDAQACPGDLGAVQVTHAAPIADADLGAISFVTASGVAAVELLANTRASVVIVHEDVPRGGTAAAGAHAPVLVPCANPRLAFIRLLRRYFTPARQPGVHPSSVVDPAATLGDGIYIGPLATVGAQVKLGDRTVVHAGVHIYDRCRIGSDVTIHAGAVIGADGFGYERGESGPEHFPHIGTVVIEDDVEIGANACIDRGTLGATTIRSGAKIDNLVHIAHNVEIGEGALVIAHAMIGGSTRIGDGCWIAPSACLRDNIDIGAGATVGLGSVVLSNVPAGMTVTGAPARELAEVRAVNEALRRMIGR